MRRPCGLFWVVSAMKVLVKSHNQNDYQAKLVMIRIKMKIIGRRLRRTGCGKDPGWFVHSRDKRMVETKQVRRLNLCHHKNTQIHNTQIHKYTNTRYTNTQLHKYTNTLYTHRLERFGKDCIFAITIFCLRHLFK